MGPVLTAALIGGVLSYEYRTSIRLYLSAPLVSGLIMGLVFGYPVLGLTAGLLMQLLFIGTVRLRGRPEADLPAAGVIASSAFIIVSRDLGQINPMSGLIMFWSLLLGLVVAAAGSIFYTQWEKFAARLAGRGSISPGDSSSSSSCFHRGWPR